MPIRISWQSSETGSILRIEGRLLSGDLDILRDVWDAHPGPVRLELSELQFADRESVELLRRFMAERAELGSASPYLDLLLHTQPAEDGERASPPDEGGPDS